MWWTVGGVLPLLWAGNAIQAMGNEGTLRILAHPEGRWIKIRIEDTGSGIPQAEISRLFTPFHTTKAEGPGLGLAYSKKVIEGMAGKIELGNLSNQALPQPG